MRGILMIEELYHQTVAGNKTMTRRESGLEEVNDFSVQMNGVKRSPDDCKLVGTVVALGDVVKEYLGKPYPVWKQFSKPSRFGPVNCRSLYKIGEILYIKEPWNKELIYHDPDNDDSRYRFSYAYDKLPHIRKLIKWNNKMFMPAAAARAFIKITDIKCERLLDISIEDAKAEGIFYHKHEGWNNYYKRGEDKNIHSFGSAIRSFFSLFRYANNFPIKRAIRNTWVWVYTYEYLPNYQLNSKN